MLRFRGSRSSMSAPAGRSSSLLRREIRGAGSSRSRSPRTARSCFGGNMAVSRALGPAGRPAASREKLHRRRGQRRVTFSPDGSLIAAPGRSHPPAAASQSPRSRARPHDATRLRAGASLTHRRPPGPASRRREGIGCLAFTPDGARPGGGNLRDATLFVWRIRGGRLLRKIPGAHGKSLAGRVIPG